MASEGEKMASKMEEVVEATETALKGLSLENEESSILEMKESGRENKKTDSEEDNVMSMKELAEALQHETVWLQQTLVETAEANFIKYSLRVDATVSSEVTEGEKPLIALEKETVWLRQQQYEEAETLYHMTLAGTKKSTRDPGTPSKRLHKQEENRDAKKLRHGNKDVPELLLSEMTQLSGMTTSLQQRLEEFEKTQQRKAQAVKDTTARLTAAVEACQTRLNGELVQGAVQLNSFRSILEEVESSVRQITNSIAEKNWGQFSSQDSFSNSLVSSVSKIRLELTQFMDACVCFHAEVPKSDINQIVGEIRKISLLKKNQGVLQFSNVKKDIEGSLRGIKKVVGSPLSDSRPRGKMNSSAEGDGVSAKSKPGIGRGQGFNLKKRPNSSHALSNRNNSSDVKTGAFSFGHQGGQVKSSFFNSRSDVAHNNSATPRKRNAYGAESTAQKKQNLFKFKGIPPSANVSFMHQRGLLGTRPNAQSQPRGNPQGPFPFTPFANRPRPLLQNFREVHDVGPAAHGSGFCNMNFNFANPASAGNFGNGSFLQPRSAPSSNFVSSSNDQAMTSSQQSRQFQQSQAGKGHHGGQSRQANFSFPFQPNQYRTGVPPQRMGGGPGGLGQMSAEQQLHKMAQKIQQMQQTASQDFQLQKLLQETERLKQMAAQKPHQQQDQFQHQFQLLINAFLQQQAQGPQSKVARSGQFHSSQRQQQRYYHNRNQQWLQQKKNKQQHNKVQQIKQEQEDSQAKGDNPNKKRENAQNLTWDNVSSKLGKNEQQESKPPMKTLPNKNSKVVRISQFQVQTPSDKLKSGISSIVALEELGCLVTMDIINKCLKLYDVNPADGSPTQLLTRLELARPYYMARLNSDTLVVSRENKLLSLVRVSSRRLEFLKDISCEFQYYGVAFVKENVIACTAYTDSKIDLVSISQGGFNVVNIAQQYRGPELIASIPGTGSILHFEEMPGVTMNLVCISQNGERQFAVDLKGSPTDVWNVSAVADKIICCNKQTSQVKLISATGNLLADLAFPEGAVKQPFAISFSNTGKLYIANDSVWDADRGHFVTSEINTFTFS